MFCPHVVYPGPIYLIGQTSELWAMFLFPSVWTIAFHGLEMMFWMNTWCLFPFSEIVWTPHNSVNAPNICCHLVAKQDTSVTLIAFYFLVITSYTLNIFMDKLCTGRSVQKSFSNVSSSFISQFPHKMVYLRSFKKYITCTDGHSRVNRAGRFLFFSLQNDFSFIITCRGTLENVLWVVNVFYFFT